MKPFVRSVAGRCYRFLRRRRPAPGAVILMYHRVLPDPADDRPGVAVSETRFTAQLEALEQARFIVTGLGELLERLREGEPGAVVALTFDDGTRDHFEHVFPALRARRLTATFFVATDGVDRGEPVPGAIAAPMTWAEVGELRRQGMCIGSHGVSHRSLARLPAPQRRRELRASRALLERRLEAPVRCLAYPYGRPRDVDGEVVGDAADAGYELACTASPGPVRPDSHPLLLRRLDVHDWRAGEFLYHLEWALRLDAPAERFAS